MPIEINFIYIPHKGDPKKIYEDTNGCIWMSSKKDASKINVALGYLANTEPSGLDSLLALEPMCIMHLDYQKEHANMFHKVFTWCKPAMKRVQQEKIVEINHPSWDDPPKFEELIRPKWEDRDGIVIVSNNKTAGHSSNIYALRTLLADHLYECGMNVSWYGTDTMDKPYFKGPVKNKLDVIRKAKFCICPENCYNEKYSYGYFSEKMPDAWFGGAVPLYMGCYNIDNLNIAHDAYIDLRKYVNKHNLNLDINFQKIIERINTFSKNEHELILEKTEANMKDELGLFDVISRSKAYSKIIESFL